MSTQNQNNLGIEAARKILAEFSCIAAKPVNSESHKAQLRQALLLLTSLSDYENLGVCADTATQGLLALAAYSKALGYSVSFDESTIALFEGAVYIKFNSQKQSYYLDSYTGKYRGVLVSCQSLENELLNGTYGHLPLDLFS